MANFILGLTEAKKDLQQMCFVKVIIILACLHNQTSVKKSVQQATTQNVYEKKNKIKSTHARTTNTSGHNQYCRQDSHTLCWPKGMQPVKEKLVRREREREGGREKGGEEVFFVGHAHATC